MSLDIAATVAQMTLEEKAALCTGRSSWTTTPIDRLGVPALLVTDGPHGIRRARYELAGRNGYPPPVSHRFRHGGHVERRPDPR